MTDAAARQAEANEGLAPGDMDGLAGDKLRPYEEMTLWMERRKNGIR